MYACVCKRNSSILRVCLLWLFWGWGRCSVCSYIGERARAKEGENHEACKRWMCALITVMAIVAFHLLSLKHLVTPSSWWCKFLPRLITHMTSRRYWAHSKALSDTDARTYACMHAHTSTYGMHQRTQTPAQLHGRWQWPGTLQQRQGQEGSGRCCALRRDELSSANCYPTIGYIQANLHWPPPTFIKIKKEFCWVVHGCETSAD